MPKTGKRYRNDSEPGRAVRRGAREGGERYVERKEGGGRGEGETGRTRLRLEVRLRPGWDWTGLRLREIEAESGWRRCCRRGRGGPSYVCGRAEDQRRSLCAVTARNSSGGRDGNISHIPRPSMLVRRAVLAGFSGVSRSRGSSLQVSFALTAAKDVSCCRRPKKGG